MRQMERWNRPIAGLALALMALALGGCSGGEAPAGSNAPPKMAMDEYRKQAMKNRPAGATTSAGDLAAQSGGAAAPGGAAAAAPGSSARTEPADKSGGAAAPGGK